jgi:hypothetical protein
MALGAWITGPEQPISDCEHLFAHRFGLQAFANLVVERESHLLSIRQRVRVILAFWTK